MHRIDTPNADTDKHGSGKDGFKDGGAPGSSATSLDADMFDSLQEGPVRSVEASGEAPDKTDLDQLTDAIRFFANINAMQTLVEQTAVGSDITSVAADPSGADGIVIMGTDTNGQRSTDGGFAWSAITGQVQITEMVAHGNNQYIAVGSSTNNIQSSTTGVTWISENTGTGTGEAVIWDGTIGLWCVVGDDTGSWIVTSPDGLAWTARSAAGSNRFYGVASNGTVFVAVGANGAIETSPDGITWTARTAAGSYSDRFTDVVWTGKVFVAVGFASAGNGEVQTSPDGITWTQRTADAGLSGDAFVVENVGGVIVAIDNTGTMMFSHGNCGGAWVAAAPTIATYQLPPYIQAIAHAMGRPIVVDTGNKIHTGNVFAGV